MTRDEVWAPLPLAEWQPTYDTVHLWLQIIGKIRIGASPLINHWWNSALHFTTHGLTTSPLAHENGAFEISLDFIDHRLVIDTSWAPGREHELQPQTSADFYAMIMKSLADLGIHVHVWPVTVEMPEAIHLDTDRTHATYDRAYVTRWWRIMLAVESVLEEYRARFIGKSSPVHFFWGSCDVAVTRFSGRRAPYREGAGEMMNESYSHEVHSVGFWPGTAPVEASFYAYAAPTPEGFDKAPVKPPQARWDTSLGEYLLAYEDVRTSASPRDAILDFAQSTYEAAATLGRWNRDELERKPR